jgi:DNA ligase-1
MVFPKLYKKTSTGAIQYWSTEVTTQIGQMNDEEYAPEWGLIVTRFGQVDGKEQITNETIIEGKNIGKSNETTPYQQAEKEAEARWTKQLKKGYVESIQAAEAGELDKLIEGGISPMLAHTFSKQGHKIKYPCFVQPKLDGIRCIAIIKDGGCTLWSRTRKPITSCPHIVAELESIFAAIDITLDGELYNPDFKDNFEHIVHLVRQEEPDENCTDIQYHIYDIVTEGNFSARHGSFIGMVDAAGFLDSESSLRFVQTELVRTEDEVMMFFDKYKSMGYEGAMLRNMDGRYTNKRSYDLQKVKEFQDAEFEIVDIQEGRAKLSGHVGAFVCRTSDGTEFLAKLSGDTKRLRDYFNDHSLWRGKRLTVQFQGLTGKNNVPRFPVGISIRDYE